MIILARCVSEAETLQGLDFEIADGSSVKQESDVGSIRT